MLIIRQIWRGNVNGGLNENSVNKDLNNNLSNINSNINNNIVKNDNLITINPSVNSKVFFLDISDTIFTITHNNDIYNKGIGNVIYKMIVIKEEYLVDIDSLSESLGNMGIDTLKIFHIGIDWTLCHMLCEKGADVMYIQTNPQEFIEYLNTDTNFFKYNHDSLYIIRGGNFLDIKNIFSYINNTNVNTGKGGGSQKTHILSPLEVRLSFYLMAIFKFNYNLFKYLNTFNIICKDRYLSHTNMKFKRIKLENSGLIFKPLTINKFPIYSINLHEHLIGCSCKKDIN
jgi:hypothetical protein